MLEKALEFYQTTIEEYAKEVGLSITDAERMIIESYQEDTAPVRAI